MMQIFATGRGSVVIWTLSFFWIFAEHVVATAVPVEKKKVIETEISKS